MDAEQFSLEYKQWFKRTVLTLGRMRARNAEDIAQEAWARAWEKRDTFRGTSFSAWVKVIAVNCYRNELRKRTPLQLDGLDDRTVRDHTEAVLDAEKLLSMIKPSLAAAIRLQYIDGYTVAESCAVEHLVSSATFRVRIHRGLEACRVAA